MRFFDRLDQLVESVSVRAARRARIAGHLSPGFGHLDLVLLDVEGEVLAEPHLPGQIVRPIVHHALFRLRLAGRGADDERRAGLVDEDAVGFVHQGEEVAALHARIGRRPGRAPSVHGPQNGVLATCPPLRLSRSRRKSKPNSDAVP